ncbi:MAG: 5-formyltetrahydrofolate cyclo-ligase [Candidatus Nanopelagicales bacterium]
MTTPFDEIQQQKLQLRNRVTEARNTLRSGSSDTRASAFALNAMQFVKSYTKPGDLIALFVSFGYEPPTDMFIGMLEDLGYGVLLPRVENSAEIGWYRYDGTWSLDSFGIAAPYQSTEELNSAMMLFIPAFAASNDGRRLGRGKGFYDRALKSIPSFANGGPFRVAVTDIAGLLEPGVIPLESHDELVDAVLVG